MYVIILFVISFFHPDAGDCLNLQIVVLPCMCMTEYFDYQFFYFSCLVEVQLHLGLSLQAGNMAANASVGCSGYIVAAGSASDIVA